MRVMKASKEEKHVQPMEIVANKSETLKDLVLEAKRLIHGEAQLTDAQPTNSLENEQIAQKKRRHQLTVVNSKFRQPKCLVSGF